MRKMVHGLAVDTATHRVYAPEQQEDGKPAQEWFVPSKLKMKNEYGVWWITSERDLGWVLSPDDL